MNRTLLLENLPDLLEDLDARLTALEAKPQETSVDWKQTASRAISENERLTDENKRLHDANDDLWVENVRFATERNALAAQVDDLRNVNAGLRKDNAELADRARSYQSDSFRRRSAIAAIEWYGEYNVCPWCQENEDTGHNQNCQRQAALR